jgi:hypothetical protein
MDIFPSSYITIYNKIEDQLKSIRTAANSSLLSSHGIINKQKSIPHPLNCYLTHPLEAKQTPLWPPNEQPAQETSPSVDATLPSSYYATV